MGQKVNPHGMRVGINQDWDSKWFAEGKDFAKYIKQDDTIRKFLKEKYYASGISKIVIERSEGKITVDMHTGRPGVLIGKAGAGAEELKKEIQKLAPNIQVTLNIIEVKKPDMDAQLVAENIAAQLEKRIAFRRAMRQC
ncbi:MAG: 30S ribosomal protein S3, partial [Clostridia bacterium]